MPGCVVCDCCGREIPATPADVGRAVVCPTSRRLVIVRRGDLREGAVPPAPAGRPGRWLAPAVLILLLVGAAGFLGWYSLDRPQPGEAVVAEADAETTPAPGGGEEPRPDAKDAVPPPALPRPNPVEPPAGLRAASPAAVAVVPPAAPTAPVSVGDPVGTATGPTASVQRDARGMAVHRLAKRIDLRTPDELQRELLGVREISLDVPAAPQTAKHLFEAGVARRAAGRPYPGSALAAKGRDDLAGLPFRLGPDAVHFKTPAEALDVFSRRLREEVQRCIPAGRADPRPDPDTLYAALLAGDRAGFRDAKWATAEAVPCVRQMLQAEGRDVRRMSVELLRGIPDPAATDALVRWAVYDLDPANRAAAVAALAAREKPAVTALLLTHLRFPWPRAADHAAEALVALDCRSAVPDLAALLTLADPDAPRPVELSGQATIYRRELVRVNHARNCLLCHAPSSVDDDLVRGAIPDPSRPLPPPTTPAYYRGGGQFVTAATTYLRQDFSVVQPVPSPGMWPDQQRFDYLVAVRQDKAAASSADDAASPYRAAVLFALRELSGRDLGSTAAAWVGLRDGRDAPDDGLSPEAMRFLALRSNPEALILFYLQEFGPSFLSLAPAEQAVVLARFRRVYGTAATRYALVAYLEDLVRSGGPDVRVKAATLLAATRGQADDPGPPDAAAAGKLLAHPDPRIRAAAAGALGGPGGAGKAQMKNLMKALADPDADVRAAVATALGDLSGGPNEKYDALALATQDAAGRVRTAAADALRRLKYLPASCARPLAEGLIKKGGWDAAGEREAFEKVCVGLLEEMKDQAGGGYPALVRAAAGETPTDAPAAALSKLLATAGPPPRDQLAPLAVLLTRAEYRAAAAAQLLLAGDDAVPVLIAALKDERVQVRVAAAGLLGRAAALNRNPPVARGSWRAAMDALATAKGSDAAAAVREAAAAALSQLSAGQ